MFHFVGYNRICKICQKKFVAFSKRQIYCSKKCKRKRDWEYQSKKFKELNHVPVFINGITAKNSKYLEICKLQMPAEEYKKVEKQYLYYVNL